MSCINEIREAIDRSRHRVIYCEMQLLTFMAGVLLL